MSQQCMRWWEYLSQYNFGMKYLKGEKNKVVDSLLCYYSNDRPDEVHDISTYVNAVSRLDPEGDNLPSNRQDELLELNTYLAIHESEDNTIHDKIETQEIKSKELTSSREVGHIETLGLDLEDNSITAIFKCIPLEYINNKFFSEIWKHVD
ncbi:hypothetical protein APHAL10511_008129 [Amanita phalloides]|nr:hypothetical protein APHAL10511_008129 [Amanita phalloides]